MIWWSNRCSFQFWKCKWKWKWTFEKRTLLNYDQKLEKLIFLHNLGECLVEDSVNNGWLQLRMNNCPNICCKITLLRKLTISDVNWIGRVISKNNKVKNSSFLEGKKIVEYQHNNAKIIADTYRLLNLSHEKVKYLPTVIWCQKIKKSQKSSATKSKN